MFKNFRQRYCKASDLALDLKPGDNHYRAYIGPPKDYDLVSAMVFNLLTCLGLRQHHRVLDIGCGSLRIGRLLIPYLNRGNYFGVEPNEWLVREGIKHETGKDLIKIKSPTFSFEESMKQFPRSLNLDFAVAQSIFSHTGADLLHQWLKESSFHLSDDGALLATFIASHKDFEGSGWIYPQCVGFRPKTIEEIAAKYALNFQIIDWAHPRQTWCILSRSGYDKELLELGRISWNNRMNALQKNRRAES